MNVPRGWKASRVVGDGATALARHLPSIIVKAVSARTRRTGVLDSEFFGINVAGSEHPESDDFTVDALRRLGVKGVRVDLTYDCFGSFAERFVRRLVQERFLLLLHLVQPPDEARAMADDGSARTRWREFVERVLDTFPDVSTIEVGSTPNRSRWSGYSYAGYLNAFAVACEAAHSRGVTVAGPNVTDFEPLHNIILISLLTRNGHPPDIHTDNLFVERVLQPEISDYRVAGSLIAKTVNLDLPGKAGILSSISDQFGIAKTFCTHVSWSKRRVLRLQQDFDGKQADYLVRYLVLGAASGGLDRVYWGPLVGQREGLIDDGVDEYPVLPRVALHDRTYGQPNQYRERPSFSALASLTRLLSGSRCTRWITDTAHTRIYEFECEDGQSVHVGWTEDGGIDELRSYYPDDEVSRARAIDRDGTRLPQIPATLNESPIFLVWPTRPQVCAASEEHRRSIEIVAPPPSAIPCSLWTNGTWQGALTVPSEGDAGERASDLYPERLETYPAVRVLRESRNRVWTIADPADAPTQLLVKRSKTTSGARLSWNNASQLRRRGVATPPQIAFFEPIHEAGRSYYLSEYLDRAWSARHAFSELGHDHSGCRGFSKATIYHALARFILKMHGRGVFHRDLSAGNLLMQPDERLNLKVYAIDFARAVFFDKPLGLRRRIADLMRICHPLDWDDRELLVSSYFNALGRDLPDWWTVPFSYYDWKHHIKNAFRSSARSLRHPKTRR